MLFLYSILLTSGAQCHMTPNWKSLVWLKNNWNVACIMFVYTGKNPTINLDARSTTLFYCNQVSQVKLNC